MNDEKVNAELAMLWIRAARGRKAPRGNGFQIREKQDSKLMKALYYGALMFLWNRKFLTDYTTTIGNTIYVTEPVDGIDGLALLNHEVQHVEDSRRVGTIAWTLGYLFPQCLVLLAPLGFVWSPLWLFALALGPWPAPFRVWAEARGYVETFNTYARHGVELDSEKVCANLERTFCGWGYYRMAWRWTPLRRHFLEHIQFRANARTFAKENEK